MDGDDRRLHHTSRPDAGTLPYQAPVGTAVEVTFEEVAPGHLIHEWRTIA
jgi:hypothetical protein